MKALRTELTAEGRLDILKRVMAYRGGSLEETLDPLRSIADR